MKYQDTAVNGNRNSADSGADLTCTKCEQRGSLVFSGKNESDTTLLLPDMKYCPTSLKTGAQRQVLTSLLRSPVLKRCWAAGSVGIVRYQTLFKFRTGLWVCTQKITFGTQNAVLSRRDSTVAHLLPTTSRSTSIGQTPPTAGGAGAR